MPHCPEHLLRLIRLSIQQPSRIKQIQTLAVINGHLQCNPSDSSQWKWTSTFLFNALIRAYLNIGEPYKTIVLFTQMLDHQAPPNNFTFPSVIKAASSSPYLASLIGRPLHAQVIRRALYLDPFIQTSFINFYGRYGVLLDAQRVFDEISEPNIVSCNAMLYAFCSHGNMESAISLFERMPKRDVFSWTSIVSGFGNIGLYGDAFRYFEKMITHVDVISGIVRPNEATFVSVLYSCANSDGRGSLYRGKQIHGYIIKNEGGLSAYLGTALISFYGKLGCISYALNIFEHMEFSQVCTWNSVISSLASNGHENQALDTFHRMKSEHILPNEVTFIATLTACSRAKYVGLGLELFASMSRDFGIAPRMEHYGCVVDLLGRAGLLREADIFIKGMPFEPDETVLGALLWACKVHGAIELGNEVGRRLLELRPTHSSRYVALSSIYACAERWDRASRLRKAVITFRLYKVPAFSFLDSMKISCHH